VQRECGHVLHSVLYSAVVLMYGFMAIVRGVRKREERSASVGDWSFMIE